MATDPARILLVEDDQGIRDWLADALTDENYEVETAGSGRHALERLAESQPDLIMLDLRMPDMDGWTFRKEQLADPALQSIPVLIMTAGIIAPDEAAGLAAAGFLQKPFDLNDMLDTVANCLGLS